MAVAQAMQRVSLSPVGAKRRENLLSESRRDAITCSTALPLGFSQLRENNEAQAFSLGVYANLLLCSCQDIVIYGQGVAHQCPGGLASGELH